MKTIHGMILKMFFPVFMVTLLFFMMVFQLVDLFSNLWRYMQNQVTVMEMGRIAFYFIPRCITFSMPIAFLFSITFTLGNFYMNNEMIAIFGSGISLYRVSGPFILISILLSLSFFLFEENVAIPTYIIRNELQRAALHQPEEYKNTDFSIKSADGKIIYQPRVFNARQESCDDVTILERDEQGHIVRRIDCRRMKWDGSLWILEDCRVFSWNEDNTIFGEKFEATINDARFNEKPRLFAKQTREIDEMEYGNAKDYIQGLMAAGRNYQKELSEYYKKFAFSLTPVIVALISCAVGGLLRKNILIMSLLFSIFIVVGYYVVQLITMALSGNGYIHPIAGAWTAIVLFLFIGVLLFRIART